MSGRKPLKVDKHPQTQCKVYHDKEVTFTVSATGAGTISYQWMKDKEPIKSDEYSTYTGINTDTLCISSFSPEHKGEYCCQTSNGDSCIISDAAELQGTIDLVHPSYHIILLLTLALEIIEQHPESQNKIYENEVTLTVSAAGPGTVSYQWIRDGEEITDRNLPNCSGFTTPNLHFDHFSPEHVGQYMCIVSNEYCALKSQSGKLNGNLS